MQKLSISKAFHSAAIATTSLAVAAVAMAFALQTTLSYRIGPSNYEHYLWAGRFSIAASITPLIAIVLGFASGFRFLQILNVGCIMFMVVFMPASIHSGPNPAAWCYFNLRKIDIAKEVLRRERNLTNECVITVQEISPLIEDGFQRLKCQEGGVYTIGPIGTDPYCSVHGALGQIGNQPKQAK